MNEIIYILTLHLSFLRGLLGPIKEGEFGNSAPGGKPSDDITNAIAAATKAAAALAEKTSVITPQAAMEAAMKEMHEKVQAETGTSLHGN